MEFYTDPAKPPNQKLPDGYIWDWDETNGRWGFITDPNKGSKPSAPPTGWPSNTNWYSDPSNPPAQQLPPGYVWDWNPTTRSWGFKTTTYSSPVTTTTPVPDPTPSPGTGGSNPNPTPSPTPISADPPKTTYTAPTGIKQANPDIIIFDEAIDPEFLVESFFQEFGGTELINISRHDLINGENVSYSPIINLNNLQQSFNPNNIIAIGAYQETPTRYGIDLVSRGIIEPYFNDNGDLVVEIDRIKQDESIEVEVASDGTINRIEL